MHFGIFTYGTRGDVQPFIALSLGLMEQGHRVTLFAPENFQDFVAGFGICYHPLHGDVDAILNSPEAKKVLDSGNTLRLMKLMQKGGREIQPLVNNDMLAGAPEVDVLVASVLCAVWVDCIAERLGKKWAAITFSPPAVPTRRFPFAGLAFFDNPAYNYFSHWLVLRVYWKINKKEINRFRKQLQLPVLTHNIFDEIGKKKVLDLYAISPSLIPRPADWSAEHDITGYLTVPKRKDNNNGVAAGGLSAATLETWLDSGPSPIYLGFGSMPIPNPRLFGDLLRTLLAETNHRFLFCKGWSDFQNIPDDARIFVAKEVDHESVFPRCSMAVTHGGAGTVAAILRAGIPVIVVSVFGDQPWWGKIIVRQGLGAHLPFKKLSAPRLIAAFHTAEQPEVRQAAARVGQNIHAENGLQTCIGKLKVYFGA